MAEDDEDAPDTPVEKGRWVKKEGRWVRADEEGRTRAFDEGTRYYELPSGEVVREPMGEEELGPRPGEDPDDEAGEEGGRLGGIFGGRRGEEAEEGEPPEGEEPGEGEDEEDEGPGRGILIAAVVIILILLIAGLVAAAFLDIADPLGLRDALGLGDGGDGDDGDGPPPPPPEPDRFRYPVTWGTSDGSQDLSGTATIDSSSSQDVPIADANVTMVSVILTWDDSGDGTGSPPLVLNDPDTLRLTVTPPGGDPTSEEGTNAEGGQGQVSINISLATVPSIPSVVAESRANATRGLLQQAPPVTTALGDWNVTVEFVDGGSTCQQQGGQNVDIDCSQEFSVSFSWSWYEASLGQGVLIEE